MILDWHVNKLRWWMDLNCDLEESQRVTFLIWRVIVSPCVCSTGGNVSKICRYSRPVPTVFTRINFVSMENTLCNLKDAPCWFKHNFSNLFWQEHEIDPVSFSGLNHRSNFFLPITWLYSDTQCPLFPNPMNSQWIYSSVDLLFLSCWVKRNIQMRPFMNVTAIYVDFKGKNYLSEYVLLPGTNNLQAVSKSCNMELFNWPFHFQTDVYTGVIHNGSLFGKLANY